jgi:cystathionine beta-lyase
MKLHDFDRVIDRRHTNALAVEGCPTVLSGPQAPTPAAGGVIAMWVADMQFAAPPAAIEAMAARLEHPVFGYTIDFDDRLFEAFRTWCEHRYDWPVRRAETRVSLGVIPTLYDLVDCVCGPGDKVLSLTPAYAYFKHAAVHHGREFITSPLLKQGTGYDIDFEDFEAKAKDPKVRIFFLCHPHNPTGRVWREDELRRLGEICLANDVLVVSDEVHCDLLRHGLRHVPMARLFPGDRGIVTCMAPSKTFNLAGMMTALVVIPDADLLTRWESRRYPFANPLGLAAATGVFRNGAEWLDQLLAYLDDNFALLARTLSERLPRARFRIPDATYLAWVDVSAYFPAGENLTRFFLEHAGVALEGGEMFVDNGEGMIRLNIACPRSQLRIVLERMCDAIDHAPRHP